MKLADVDLAAGCERIRRMLLTTREHLAENGVGNISLLNFDFATLPTAMGLRLH